MLGGKMYEIYESPQILNPKEIKETLNILKEAFNKIKEKFIEIKSRHEINKFKKEVKIIKSLMEDILDFLKENPLFDNEFYDFYSIKIICDYIFEDIRMFHSLENFILRLLRNFKKLIFYKLEYKGENYNYKLKYARFKNFLEDQEEIFYTEIYYYDGKNKELICELNNIMWGDEY